MNRPMDRFLRTHASTSAFVARLVAGAPLLFFGVLKLVSADTQENFRATLELAQIPSPGVMMWGAATVEVLAGLSLVFGLLTRLGGFLAVLQMAVALYVHSTGATNQAPEGGPPIWLPILVLAGSVWAMVVGGGRFSVDKALLSRPVLEREPGKQ